MWAAGAEVGVVLLPGGKPRLPLTQSFHGMVKGWHRGPTDDRAGLGQSRVHMWTWESWQGLS